MKSSVISIMLAIFLLGSVSLIFVAKKANNSLDKVPLILIMIHPIA